MPVRIMTVVLEWLITVVILMIAEKIVKNVWRVLKNLRNVRTVEIHTTK